MDLEEEDGRSTPSQEGTANPGLNKAIRKMKTMNIDAVYEATVEMFLFASELEVVPLFDGAVLSIIYSTVTHKAAANDARMLGGVFAVLSKLCSQSAFNRSLLVTSEGWIVSLTKGFLRGLPEEADSEWAIVAYYGLSVCANLMDLLDTSSFPSKNNYINSITDALVYLSCSDNRGTLAVKLRTNSVSQGFEVSNNAIQMMSVNGICRVLVNYMNLLSARKNKSSDVNDKIARSLSSVNIAACLESVLTVPEGVPSALEEEKERMLLKGAFIAYIMSTFADGRRLLSDTSIRGKVMGLVRHYSQHILHRFFKEEGERYYIALYGLRLATAALWGTFHVTINLLYSKGPWEAPSIPQEVIEVVLSLHAHEDVSVSRNVLGSLTILAKSETLSNILMEEHEGMLMDIMLHHVNNRERINDVSCDLIRNVAHRSSLSFLSSMISAGLLTKLLNYVEHELQVRKANDSITLVLHALGAVYELCRQREGDSAAVLPEADVKAIVRILSTKDVPLEVQNLVVYIIAKSGCSAGNRELFGTHKVIQLLSGSATLLFAHLPEAHNSSSSGRGGETGLHGVTQGTADGDDDNNPDFEIGAAFSSGSLGGGEETPSRKIVIIGEQNSENTLRRREIRENIPRDFETKETPREATPDFNEAELNNTLRDLILWEKQTEHSEVMEDYKPVCDNVKGSKYHIISMKLRNKKYLKKGGANHWLSRQVNKYFKKNGITKADLSHGTDGGGKSGPAIIPDIPSHPPFDPTPSSKDGAATRVEQVVLESILVCLWTLTDDSNANLEAALDKKVADLARVIIHSSKSNDTLKQSAVLLQWFLCASSPAIKLTVNADISIDLYKLAASHFRIPSLRYFASKYLLWLESKSGISTFRSTLENFLGHHHHLEIIYCSFLQSINSMLAIEGCKGVARVAIGERGTASKKYLFNSKKGLLLLATLKESYATLNVETLKHCLTAILNISTLPDMQVVIARNSLSILISLSKIYKASDPSIWLIISGIMSNIAKNGSNRTLLYKAELHEKMLRHLPHRGAEQHQHAASAPQVSAGGGNLQKQSFDLESLHSVKADPTKRSFLEWCDRINSDNPAKNESAHFSMPQSLDGPLSPDNTFVTTMGDSGHSLYQSRGHLHSVHDDIHSQHPDGGVVLSEHSLQSSLATKPHHRHQEKRLLSPIKCTRVHTPDPDTEEGRDSWSRGSSSEYPEPSLHGKLELNMRTLWGGRPSTTLTEPLKPIEEESEAAFVKTSVPIGRERWAPDVKSFQFKVSASSSANPEAYLKEQKLQQQATGKGKGKGKQNLIINVGVNSVRGHVTMKASPRAPSLIPHITLDAFEHVEGSKVYEEYFKSYVAPDGRKYHIYYKDNLHETAVEEIESSFPPPRDWTVYNTAITPQQLLPEWPSLHRDRKHLVDIKKQVLRLS